MCFFTLGRYDALWVVRIYLCSLSASWLGLSSTPKFYRNVSLYHCDLPNSLARKSREFLALRVTDSLIVPVHCQFRNFLWFGWKEKNPSNGSYWYFALVCQESKPPNIFSSQQHLVSD